eukprot:2694348-Prymnesium_polylepis.2
MVSAFSCLFGCAFSFYVSRAASPYLLPPVAACAPSLLAHRRRRAAGRVDCRRHAGGRRGERVRERAMPIACQLPRHRMCACQTSITPAERHPRRLIPEIGHASR